MLAVPTLKSVYFLKKLCKGNKKNMFFAYFATTIVLLLHQKNIILLNKRK